MRILRGVAVSREVLRTRCYALTLEAGDESGNVARDEPRIGAERPDPDHRVVGIRVHVGDGSEVEVDPDLAELARDRRGDLLGQRRVVDDAERPVSGIGAADPSLEACDVAAFFVGRDEQLAFASEPPGQRFDLFRRLDVAAEQDDTAEPALDPAQHPVGSGGAFEAREEARRCGALELNAHPLTAPAVTPKAILRWIATKKSTTGSAVSVAPAISGPQAVPRSVMKPASHRVNVWLPAWCTRTDAMRYSFQAWMNAKIEVATSPGPISGSRMRTKAPNRVEPSTCAASSRS